ncbi:MAG TPA: heavy metal translocating P-type ATPase metal-binding domain-containing protein, partial [Burkholderiaceae bacterium]|nr:heavy metal translocating P-type ATPase metal-binding domain-containing protein [Burkholderiaceae bacterium]
MSEPSQSCFHCGLPVPAGTRWRAVVDGVARPMCCPGCEAVARTIVEAGLAGYYRHRTEAAPTARAALPGLLADLAVWDHPAIQRAVVRDGGATREAALLLEDLNCAACVWLTEQHLLRLGGVREVAVNFATRRATVRWDPTRTGLAAILGAIAAIGFRAHPYDPRRALELLEAGRRDLLLRWLVAGALGMQVMMLAFALYAGDWFGIEPEFARLFRWASLVATVPILVFSARPFFTGAWRDLAARRVGMDVPVALGLALAFLGSLPATVADRGAVYYDSVAMFVFLLLGARLLETVARARAAREQEGLVRAAPATARRLAADGAEELVPTVELAVGERVRVLPGEAVPADGVVVAGVSSHPGKFGFVALHNLLRFGYRGEIFPVNRDGAEVLGRKCLRDVSEIPPGRADLVFVCTPNAANVALLRACAKVGVRAAFVASAGYGEAGPEGRALERELVAVADELGMLIAGPNGQGVI